MIYRTSTYYKIRRIKSKIKVIQGGQGAGKNVAIAQILLEDCARDKDITTVMSDTYDNLKDGAIADFKMLYDSADLIGMMIIIRLTMIYIIRAELFNFGIYQI